MGRMAWGALVLGMCDVLSCSGATEENGPGGGAGNATGGAAGNATSGAPNAHTPGMNAGGSSSPAGATGKPNGGGGSGTGGSGNTNGNFGGSGIGGQVSVGGAAGNGGMACTPQDVSTADPGTGTCPSFTACGGDITGKWSVTLICSDPVFHSYSELCADATDTTDVSGVLEFKADGTYLAQASIHAQGTVPQSCLTKLQGTCGANAFEGCVPSGQGCTCDYHSPPKPAAAGYTWTANGNALLLVHACETEVAHFCVHGDELELRARTGASRFYVYHGTRQ